MKDRNRTWRSGVIALALAAVTSLAAAARAQTGQLTDHPVTLESPSDFDRDVRTVRDGLAQLSSSDPASREQALRNLALQVEAFLGRRILAGPARDEQNPAFIAQLNQTYGSFVLALKNLDRLGIKTLDLGEFEAVSYQAYVQNFKAFADFYQQRYSTAHLEQPAVLRTVITFSLVVYAEDRVQWKSATKRTHFWPLCILLK